MARLIGGIGTSHIPSLAPVMDRGLQQTPEWTTFFDGYRPIQEWLRRERPDIAIVVYNDHGTDLFLDKMPTFAVGAAAEYPPGDEGWGIRKVPTARGDLAFSWHAIEQLVDDEFDPTICQELLMDHGFLVPMGLLWNNDWPVKVLPVAVNVIQHPVPTALRCFKLGQSLRRAIDSYPTNETVVIVGTGGMSHQLHGERVGFLNRSFDEMFVDRLEHDPLALTRISRHEYMERAGAEAVELIMWLAMRGALDSGVRLAHRFYQSPVSLTAAGAVLFENAISPPLGVPA
jgi:protocatechuate 4,5-dioxygenase beta chain